MPAISNASDYATLHAKHADCYYGYEILWCPQHGFVDYGQWVNTCDDCTTEWCFSAKINGQHIRIPSSKLRVEDPFNCQACLLAGIGWLFEKWPLDTNA